MGRLTQEQQSERAVQRRAKMNHLWGNECWRASLAKTVCLALGAYFLPSIVGANVPPVPGHLLHLRDASSSEVAGRGGNVVGAEVFSDAAIVGLRLPDQTGELLKLPPGALKALGGVRIFGRHNESIADYVTAERAEAQRWGAAGYLLAGLLAIIAIVSGLRFNRLSRQLSGAFLSTNATA